MKDLSQEQLVKYWKVSRAEISEPPILTDFTIGKLCRVSGVRRRNHLNQTLGTLLLPSNFLDRTMPKTALRYWYTRTGLVHLPQPCSGIRMCPSTKILVP